MISHIGHNAQCVTEGKRLLHYALRYPDFMSGPAERLRIARERAGYASATDAAAALHIKRSTYIGHENGQRGYRANSAAIYAKKFKVSVEWLLYGTGDGPLYDRSEVEQAADLFRSLTPDKRAEALGILKVLSGTA